MTVCGSTHIADREADIFALFARRPQGTDLLVRAAHDRALEDGGRLFAKIDTLAVAGRAVLDRIRHERPTFRNFLLPVQTRPILGWSGCGTWAATMMRIVLSTVLNT